MATVSSFKPWFEIKTIKIPLPDEIIVINFHQGQVTCDEAHQILKEIEKEFPYNQIIGKFNNYDICKTSNLEVLG